MKKILFVLELFTSMMWAGFDFGECSGSNTFEQQIEHYGTDKENAVIVGTIPKGIQGLKIELISDKDVDIRLYGENNDKIVHWPYGIHNQYNQKTKPYQNVDVTYSGYNGIDGKLGNEFIEINGTTPTAMTMKAFGYKAGYATVNYSWNGKDNCEVNKNGTGYFSQKILKNTTVLVGVIPKHIENLKINLQSNKDLDIQLYGEDGTAIVSWKPQGLLSGASKDSIDYKGMHIEWSGYNGINGEKGYEYIKVTPKVTEALTMKVYGYEVGTADVAYVWGDSIAPVFQKENLVERVGYGSAIGSVITQINATDDKNATLSYHLEGDVPFSIDNKGLITVNGPLLNNNTYTVQVIVSDGFNEATTKLLIVTTPNGKEDIAEWIDYSSEYNITHNMHGDLLGQLWFMQSQMHRPTPLKDEKRPDVVAYRSALLLFMIHDENNTDQIKMSVVNQKSEVYEANLISPEEIALADQKLSSDGRETVTFSKRSWTGEIPWNFMTPKMSITLERMGANGIIQKSYLSAGEITLGPPHEIVLNNIDLGMLVEPAGQNEHVYAIHNKTAEYALNYFQTVPIAKYIVARYAPAYFPKVVMPDGTIYTDKSASIDANVYKGDMRGSIAKNLVSMGINNANIGVVSTDSRAKRYDRIVRHTVAHTARGRYTDPNDSNKSIIVQHGLSGGGAKLTLSGVVGNQFSHEYGHDHGVGHYAGGILSIHNYMSGWSYDSYKKRFIANLSWTSPPKDKEYKGEIVKPFKNLYSYNRDAMAGGNASQSIISKFTFYTPYSSKIIQDKLLLSGHIDDNSSSGYSQWNRKLNEYEVKEVNYPKPDQSEIPVMTLIGYYDPMNRMKTFIYPALYSNYGSYFSEDTLNVKIPNNQCYLSVSNHEGNVEKFNLYASRYATRRMNQFHINLPLSEGPYINAKIVCNGKIQDSREIKALDFNLRAPVIVGKQYGFINALNQIRTFSESFKIKYVSLELFEKEFNNRYASATKFNTNTTKVKAGHNYVIENKYFIALKDDALNPSESNGDWKYLGNANDYLYPDSMDTIKLNITSKDYSEVLESSGYFYVPVDKNRVKSSDTAEKGVWSKKGYSSITVIGINILSGEKENILLRATNSKLRLDSGKVARAKTYLTFKYLEEDNLNLKEGEYDISFYIYGKAWHNREKRVIVLVEDRIIR